MQINTQIENLHHQIIDVINSNNQLPAAIVYYVLKDCLNEVSKAYEQIINNERQSVENSSSEPHKLQPDEVEEVKENN